MAWMAVRAIRSRSATADPRTTARPRRDALVGLVLAAGWFGLWVLYSAYNWTAQAGSAGGGGSGGGIHLIRFYLPAIGLIALLGAWLLVQLPRWLPPALLVVIALSGSPLSVASRQLGRWGPQVAPDSPVGYPADREA